MYEGCPTWGPENVTPDETAEWDPDDSAEEARWALQEAWKQVEQKQKEAEEDPEAQAA